MDAKSYGQGVIDAYAAGLEAGVQAEREKAHDSVQALARRLNTYKSDARTDAERYPEDSALAERFNGYASGLETAVNHIRAALAVVSGDTGKEKR